MFDPLLYSSLTRFSLLSSRSGDPSALAEDRQEGGGCLVFFPLQLKSNQIKKKKKGEKNIRMDARATQAFSA